MFRFYFLLLTTSLLLSQNEESLFKFSTIKEANATMKKIGKDTKEGKAIKKLIDRAYLLSGTKTARGWLIDSLSFQKRDDAIRLLSFKGELQTNTKDLKIDQNTNDDKTSQMNVPIMLNQNSIQLKTYRMAGIILMALLIFIGVNMIFWGSLYAIRFYLSTNFSDKINIAIKSRFEFLFLKIRSFQKNKKISMDEKESSGNIEIDQIESFSQELDNFSTMSKDDKIEFIMQDQDLTYDQAVMYLDYKIYQDG